MNKKGAVILSLIAAFVIGTVVERKYNVWDRVVKTYSVITKTEVNPEFSEYGFDLQKKIKFGDRGIEFYLVTPQQELPVLKGDIGIKVGDDEYLLNNVQQRSIDSYIVEHFDELDQTTKNKLVVEYLNELKDRTVEQAKNYTKRLIDRIKDLFNEVRP